MKNFFHCVLMIAIMGYGCNNKYPIDSLPADTTRPSLSVPFVSTAAAVYVVPFAASTTSGNSLGYEITLSDVGADVLASVKAYVTDVRMIGTDDYEIHTEVKRNSVYDVIYGNVANVAIAKGDSVLQGALIGKVGANGKVTFRIERKDTRKAQCPSDFASSGFNAAMSTALIQHNLANSDTLTLMCRQSELSY